MSDKLFEALRIALSLILVIPLGIMFGVCALVGMVIKPGDRQEDSYKKFC